MRTFSGMYLGVLEQRYASIGTAIGVVWNFEMYWSVYRGNIVFIWLQLNDFSLSYYSPWLDIGIKVSGSGGVPHTLMCVF
jgi:hypothetical protein